MKGFTEGGTGQRQRREEKEKKGTQLGQVEREKEETMCHRGITEG